MHKLFVVYIISNDSFFSPITFKYHKACINDKQNSQNIDMISPTILNFNKNILKSVKVTYGTIISRQTISTDTPSVGVLTSIMITVGWTFMCTVCAKISFFTFYKNKCKLNVNAVYSCNFKPKRTTKVKLKLIFYEKNPHNC